MCVGEKTVMEYGAWGGRVGGSGGGNFELDRLGKGTGCGEGKRLGVKKGMKIRTWRARLGWGN